MPESSAHLLEALTARGISARGAAQLLAGLQPGQAAQLPAQLEYGDYLIATATHAIQNPAGFLVSCVRDNLTVPHNFATTEQQAQEAAAAALREAAAEERMKLEFAYADYQREGVAAYLAALPPEERQSLYETEEAAFLQQYPEAARRWAPGALPQTLAALRQNRLAASLPLLGLAAFAEQLWPSRRAAWEAAWAAAQEAGRAGQAAR